MSLADSGRPKRFWAKERPRRLARPRTPPFHGDNTGSNPVGDAKWILSRERLFFLSVDMAAVWQKATPEQELSDDLEESVLLPAPGPQVSQFFVPLIGTVTVLSLKFSVGVTNFYLIEVCEPELPPAFIAPSMPRRSPPQNRDVESRVSRSLAKQAHSTQDAAQKIYRQRSQIAEVPTPGLKSNCGLRQFRCRGQEKTGVEATRAILVTMPSRYFA